MGDAEIRGAILRILDMKCYCCGKTIVPRTILGFGEDFALVSYSEEPDRAFIFDLKCLSRVDNPAFVFIVAAGALR